VFIEKTCISSLLFDKDYSRKVLPYLKDEYFSDESNRVLFGHIRSFNARYNCAPTKEALVLLLEDSTLNEKLYEGCIETVAEVEASATPTEFMVDSTEKWVKDRAVFLALTECVQIAEGMSKGMTKECIPDILQQALAVHFDTYLGHDYFEHASQHYDAMHEDVIKFKFAQDILNKATRGGIPNKTLNIVQAGINVGKTTFMIDQAAHWVSQGKNVIYFSAEVAENVIRHRADVNFFDISFDELEKLDKQTYLNRVTSLKQKTSGKLIIKEYPSGSASAANFMHDIQEIKMKTGIEFDMVCVDYLGEIISSTLPMSAMSNTNTYYTQIARELRAMAFRLDLPVWTAAQFGRLGQASKDVDMTDIADAIGIARVADFMIALLQPDELAELNQVIGKILKNRYANKAKLRRFLMGVDNDRQKFYDVDQANVKEEFKKLPPEAQAVLEGLEVGLKTQADDDAELPRLTPVGNRSGKPARTFEGFKV